MTQRWFSTLLGLSALFAFALAAQPSHAQSPVQPKPPMYTYVANWQIPRAHWSQMPAAEAADKGIMDKAVADGTLIGYGDDEVLVHSADGGTHDDWWSATSVGGLLKVLAQLYASGNVSSPALDAATKHWDMVYVTHYYNWRPGSYKNAYTWVSTHELRSDAPDNAVDVLSQNIMVPILEKLLADGTLIEYEIDELEVHSQAPGSFSIVTLTAEPDGNDKVEAAIGAAIKANPLLVPAFGSMVQLRSLHDDLLLSEGTYK